MNWRGYCSREVLGVGSFGACVCFRSKENGQDYLACVRDLALQRSALKPARHWAPELIPEVNDKIWRSCFHKGLCDTWNVEGCLCGTDRGEALVAAVFTLECPPWLCVQWGLGTGISWWAWQGCWAQLWDHGRMESWFMNLWHAPKDAHQQWAQALRRAGHPLIGRWGQSPREGGASRHSRTSTAPNSAHPKPELLSVAVEYSGRTSADVPGAHTWLCHSNHTNLVT